MEMKHTRPSTGPSEGMKVLKEHEAHQRVTALSLNGEGNSPRDEETGLSQSTEAAAPRWESGEAQSLSKMVSRVAWPKESTRGGSSWEIKLKRYAEEFGCSAKALS